MKLVIAEKPSVAQSIATKNDISWFQKIISRNPKVEVLEMSELYQNKGTTKFYRNYIEVKKKNTK